MGWGKTHDEVNSQGFLTICVLHDMMKSRRPEVRVCQPLYSFDEECYLFLHLSVVEGPRKKDNDVECHRR
nr:MAG: hypothetical protein AM324_03090 [Candidatus Thorarchaeota archaeon SMTZ1-83]